jgi:hypothetical protein
MSAFERWDPAAYLRHYYAAVADDEDATLRFLMQELAGSGPADSALDFGAGPTLHHLLPLAPLVRRIDVADVLPGNLAEIRRWLAGRAGAHDWSAFTRAVLACEGRRSDAAAVAEREALLRRRVARLLHGDAAAPQPLGAAGATADKPTCRRYLRHIAGLLAPGGLLLVACLRRCTAYHVGARSYPCAGVDEDDLQDWFADPDLGLRLRRLEVAPVPRQRHLGYAGIVLAAARSQLRCGASGSSFGFTWPSASGKCCVSKASTASTAAFSPASN